MLTVLDKPPRYIGRFAPSPTGTLHAGSLVAALASWLDARAHHGRWLVRIEDVDTGRCISGADHAILQQLAACGLHPDAPPLWQSKRTELYQQALQQLTVQRKAYACACTRKDIESALQTLGIKKPRHGELIYPGTCRNGLKGPIGRAWRLRLPDLATIHWHDRRLGAQQQNVCTSVGDFVLQRADGLFAYQLAVVVDDAAQGITHVVRGEDLTDNTARQIVLQQMLGFNQPTYMHTPLVHGTNGEKLSKQNGATPINTATPAAALDALLQAAQVLGLSAPEKRDNTDPVARALQHWIAQWPNIFPTHDH